MAARRIAIKNFKREFRWLFVMAKMVLFFEEKEVCVDPATNDVEKERVGVESGK